MSQNQLAVISKQSDPVGKFANFKQFANNKATKLAVLTGIGMTSSNAFAASTPQVPDLSPIVTMITGLSAVVGSIGMAVLTVYATAKVFKWVKTAF